MANTTSWTYNIDIVGGCNLQCPTCPVANSRSLSHSKGLMSLERFEHILQKIKRETPQIAYVGVYNWAEPMLHPQLPEMIRLAHTYQIPISLSTNFNSDKNLEDIVLAKPLSIRVSVSGFTQEFYGRTHNKGNITTVLSNLKLLRTLLDKHNSTIEVHIAYHCYKDNLGAEYTNMQALCAELGFYFLPFFAGFMPLEKLISYHEHGPNESDQHILDLLAVLPDEIREISQSYKQMDCELRSNRTAINWNGSVALCCGVYDDTYNIAPNFLEVSHEELQQRKYKHKLCETCMNHGLHVAGLYYGSHRWLKIAKERVKPQLLPKELSRTHQLMHLRQALNATFGVAAVDKIVHIARKILFRT